MIIFLYISDPIGGSCRPFDQEFFGNICSIETGRSIIGDYGPAQVFSQLHSSGFPLVISSGINKFLQRADVNEECEMLEIVEGFSRDKESASTTSQILELYQLYDYNIFDLTTPPRTAFDPINEAFITEGILGHLQKTFKHFSDNTETNEC
jgi:hypothetical protein